MFVVEPVYHNSRETMATNDDFLYNVPYPLGIVKINTINPKSFHTFDLNEDGAGCHSLEEDILMNELNVFAVGT